MTTIVEYTLGPVAISYKSEQHYALWKWSFPHLFIEVELSSFRAGAVLGGDVDLEPVELKFLNYLSRTVNLLMSEEDGAAETKEITRFLELTSSTSP